METTRNRIDEIKSNGYNLDFGTTINHTFEIYKKIVLTGGMAMLLFLGIMCALFLILLFNSVDVQNPEAIKSAFDVRQFSLLELAAYIGGLSLFTAIVSPFNAGVIKLAYDGETGKPLSIGTAFQYYTGQVFVQIFIAMLLVSFVSVAFNVILDYLNIIGVGAVLSFLCTTFTLLTLPLIIFGKLDAMDAIRGSIIVVSKNFFTVLGLLIIIYFCAFLGVIGCCIGLFFTIPLINVLQYSIYVHSVGIDTSSENIEID